MQKWEYCAVVNIREDSGGFTPENPAIWYFATDGIQVTPIKGKASSMVAKTIAELGEEGWEMVGAGNLSGHRHALYFKRAKP
jgi:hypothetical protein